MIFEEALAFVEAALQAKTGKPLTDTEEKILKAAWENETYNALADSLYLSVGHIKDLAYPLWQRISGVIGSKVTKNNFRFLIEELCITITMPETVETKAIYSDKPEKIKGNILIVDDLVHNLRFLTEILTQRRYKVRSVTKGKMALRTVRNNPADVILLDIKMPDMDGYQVCQALKAEKATSEIPVILLSALDEVFDKIKAFQVGGSDYITKPFQPEEVLARIQTQLTIHQQKLQLQQEIEQHQQTAEILYQSRALLASLLNSSLDGIAAWETVRNTTTGEIDDFRCLVVNPAFAKLFGKKREELTGKSVLKNLLNQLSPNSFAPLVRVVETGKPFEQEFYYQIDRLQKWYYFVVIKLGDGLSITVRDITELKGRLAD